MPFVRRAHPRLRKLSWIALGAVAFAILTPYARCPRYEFPPARTFEGPRLYNPYAGVAQPWKKINLHAHARAWFGLTAGAMSRDEVVRRYAALGYDAAGVSNYEQLDTLGHALDVYEQGYGIRKAHLLVVGAHHVDWLDYPLAETIDTKQDRIERARRDGALVVIPHPRLRNGFTLADLRRLCDYDAIEVASDFGENEPQWDAALSAGRLVWGIAGDDSHDASDDRKTGRAWTMVSAAALTTSGVAEAIRAGRAYAVVGRHALADVALDSLVTHGDTMILALRGAPARVRFYGRDTRLLATRPGDSARFVVPPDEPYVRAVVDTRTTRLLFNPVVRTTDARPVALNATRAEEHYASARISFGRMLALLSR